MKMKAIVFENSGPPDVLSLRTVERPEPGPGEALIEVSACGLNRIDLDLRSEIDDEMPMPHILGSDISGIVIAYGEHARGPELGRRVVVCPAIIVPGTNRCKIIGYQTQGGYAQYAVVPADNLVIIPDSLSFNEAAALPLAGITAHYALFDHGLLQPGQRVLVTGGTGGVGNLAVQMALSVGCSVTSTAGADNRVTWLEKYGVHQVLDHTSENFAKEIAKLGPFDVIFDHIGGEVLSGCIPAIAENGHIVAIGYTLSDRVQFSLFDLFRAQASITGSYMGNIRNLECVLQMVACGKLKPVIDRVLPLSRAREAHEAIESREIIGKIVLNTQD